MALTIKNKSSYIFSPPSYIKKGKLESKVEKIINETIKEQIFNLLEINRVIYLKKVEYFSIFTIDKETNNKHLKSIMMRIKNRQIKFREILSKEIQLSGINTSEFIAFLKNHGSKEVFNCERYLENL